MTSSMSSGNHHRHHQNVLTMPPIQPDVDQELNKQTNIKTQQLYNTTPNNNKNNKKLITMIIIIIINNKN